jgi:hypothetical protein
MYNQFNKTLFISAIVFLLSASLFVACKSADEKSADETAETTTVPTDVTTEVTTTTTETTPSEWLPFKESATLTINNNQERIKALKEKIKKSNTPNLDKLRQKRIDALEDRNTALHTKIMDHKVENVTISQVQFIAELQKELDEMEKELKELDK